MRPIDTKIKGWKLTEHIVQRIPIEKNEYDYLGRKLLKAEGKPDVLTDRKRCVTIGKSGSDSMGWHYTLYILEDSICGIDYKGWRY